MVLRVEKGDIRSVLTGLEARTGRRVEYQDDEAERQKRMKRCIVMLAGLMLAGTGYFRIRRGRETSPGVDSVEEAG